MSTLYFHSLGVRRGGLPLSSPGVSGIPSGLSDQRPHRGREALYSDSKRLVDLAAFDRKPAPSYFPELDVECIGARADALVFFQPPDAGSGAICRDLAGKELPE